MNYLEKINGYENENEFVYYFNNKKIKELDPISQELINTLFLKVDPEMNVKCQLNLKKQKSDIVLKIGESKRFISIKKGYKNSVHTESLDSFVRYLKENDMKPELINKLLRFHYADGTIDGTGKVRFTSKEYFFNHPNDIKELNAFFNNDAFLIKSINRLVLYGNNSKIPIDAIIWGEPNDYLWITRDEIINICLKHKGIAKNSLAFAGLFYQPFNRCINFNSKYEYARNFIQFKWYHLSDDIIETMAFYRK